MVAAKTLKVLLVEDEPSIAELERAVLEDSGFTVKEVRRGLQALECLGRCEGIALMVLDYRLPDMTGADVVEALGERFDRLPVVVVTGYPDSEIERALRGAGIDDYLIKDVGMKFLDILPDVAKALIESHAA